MITINIGRPRVSRRAAEKDETINVDEKVETVFNSKNVAILTSGIALGIILKQQSEIHTLKRTVNYLQEIIR